MATQTKQLQKEIKKTADDAVTTAKTAVGTAQKEVAEAATEAKESVQNVFLAGLGAFAMAEEEGSKLFKKLVKKGKKVDLPGFGKDRVKQIRKDLDTATDRAADAVKGRVSDAKYVADQTTDKVEDRVQDAVASVMKRLGVPTREEVSELTASVERLTAHIEKLKEDRAERAAHPVVLMEAVGGGWYEIKVGDVVVEKVQGKDEAEAAVVRLQASA